ncbi:HAMP domain-containing protein [Pigmentiphaga aceris]|uniref:Sensor protein n=1 Tax=Pigmentiphaga aceris TaxID=1940612 RepID=A0A5C0AV84_9BURK|nr:type IV pili methyl-accepting chemotaxis transducer N-terminal domain-containing protein [Pigmentiphaga aceris]QEI04830.1 HAMP domain-containing protein [Pigmentiphaga aceris]
MSSQSAPDDQPRLRNRLSTRIIGASLAALLIVVSMVCWTLWLSWQLEGAGAAINDTGSLRMRATRVAVALLRGESADVDMTMQNTVLARLVEGNPARPLFLPTDHDVQVQMTVVAQSWRTQLQPALVSALAGEGNDIYLDLLPRFVHQADRLVRLIERDNAGKTSLLRFSQGVLLVMAGMGTLAMIALLHLWIIAPVLRLRDGQRRLAAREMGARVPVIGGDELGKLAEGFNQMADELAAAYADLETRVEEKTAQLATQNRELAALYDMAAFLNQPNDIEQTCHGFLTRVMAQFGADGGSVRAIDPRGENLHLVVSEGLSDELEDAEHCMPVNACFCGEATRQGVIVIHDFHAAPTRDFRCAQEGFGSLAVFRIVTPDEVLGSFSLHFRQQTKLSASQTQLASTLGQHLGIALDNCRLGAKEQQLAVAQERNLVAQGLHDSIAQGLNFLNLQVQMLTAAATRGDLADIRATVPLMATGVRESYEDVRELLVNFRTRLDHEELRSAVEEAVLRFRRQTDIQVDLDIDEDGGAPLPPDQQLQVLFILQEALSNVRKHAQAQRVHIQIVNQRDFSLTVSDDGQGYDPAEVAERGERHIGLSIMAERAARIRAQLHLTGKTGHGASVSLQLAREERLSA